MSEDDWGLDLFDAYDDPGNEDGTACKYCGEDGLEWGEVFDGHDRKRWRLFDQRGEIHNCRKRPGPGAPDEFEDLDAPVD